MALSAGRSPWADVARASRGRGCAGPVAAVRCRCRPTNCSVAARSWAGWRWARCSAACRAVVTGLGSNRSVRMSSAPLRRRVSRRSHAGSWRDRDRPGRAARRTTGAVGPGGVDDRRGPLRRAPVRRGTGYRYRRDQASLGTDRRQHREHHRGHRTAHRPARAGLGHDRPILVGIDGGKALRAGIVQVFDHPVIQRCQMHKLRNVADKLPDELAATVTKKMRAAYHAPSAIIAEAQLEALARELEHTHPGAAGSLREGLAETLTVLRLGVPPTLARTLRSTNCIVIWSRAKGFLDVYDGPVRCRNLCAGRGYLSPSSTQILGRFDVRSKGGGRRLAA